VLSVKICQSGPKPIDLVYNKTTGNYDISQFQSDFELLQHIRKGKTERTLFRVPDDILNMESVFAAIEPEGFYQNPKTGLNNIAGARAAFYKATLSNILESKNWEDLVDEFAAEFNEKSKHVFVGIETYFSSGKGYD